MDIWKNILKLDRVRMCWGDENYMHIELWNCYPNPAITEEEQKPHRESILNFCSSWEELKSMKIQIAGYARLGEGSQHLGFSMWKGSEETPTEETLHIIKTFLLSAHKRPDDQK